MQKIKVICGYLKKICVVKKISFSLIESAVVLAVAGSVIGGGLTAYKSTNPKVKSDLKKMEAIENALQQYFTTNGRLPFPSHPQKGSSDANYLQEIGTTVYNATGERYMCSSTSAIASGGATHVSCATRSNGMHCCPGDFVLWGVVPTRTLGLPDDYAYDSYGHNFEYITHSALAWENGAPFDGNYSKANYATNQSGTYKVLFKHSTSPNIYIPLERLYVYNNATNKQIVTTDKNTAYVLISKGNTNKCYFNTKTGTPETTKPTGNLLKNCVQNYGNNSSVDRTIYQGYSKSFDNVVRYKTLSEIVTKASNIQEDARNLGTQTVASQLRTDMNLSTSSKEIVGAINELVGATNELKAENAALKARLDRIQSSNDTSSTLFLVGASSQTAQPTTRSQGNVYMQNGTLYLTKTTDLAGTANNKPALIVGGTDAQAHIEIDPNEIHAKANGTTVAPLYLNDTGGDVYISGSANSSLRVGRSGGTSKIYLNGEEIVTSKQAICEAMYPVGSVYITISTASPYNSLGCGTWSRVPRNAFLQSADYDNSVWGFPSWKFNVVGKTLPACAPNIKGRVGPMDDWNKAGVLEKAFYADGGRGYDAKSSSSGGGWYLAFSASKGVGDIYRMPADQSAGADDFGYLNLRNVYDDDCTTIRPYSYVVYMWYRTA